MLLLEHLGIFSHIFSRIERVKVSDISLSIEHRNERSGDLTKGIEGEVLEEFELLDFLDGGDSIFGMGDQAVKDRGGTSAPVKLTEKKIDRKEKQRTLAHRVTANQAESVKLKIKSSGLSYTGLRKTFCQFFRLAQVSSGVLPENGGKPCGRLRPYVSDSKDPIE